MGEAKHGADELVSEPLFRRESGTLPNDSNQPGLRDSGVEAQSDGRTERDTAQDIADGAGELESLEREIADRSLEDPALPPLARKAEDVTRSIKHDVERHTRE